MSVTYKRISLLCVSHISSLYSAQRGCISIANTQTSSVGPTYFPRLQLVQVKFLSLILYSLAECRAHICLELFISTLKLHVERKKGFYLVGSSHNSQTFFASVDCSSSSKTLISSFDAINITKSTVAQIICRSKFNTLLTLTPVTWRIC